MEQMADAPKRLRQREDSRSMPQLSLLSCLFAAAFIIAMESATDLIMYAHQQPIIATSIKSLVAILQGHGIKPIYAYAVEYWSPVLIFSVFYGYLLRGRGVMYSVLGTLVFLIILHNFRGFGVRHNVFRYADYYYGGLVKGVPSPLWWDMSYPLVAIGGGGAGWLLGIPFRGRGRRDGGSVGVVPTYVIAAVCFVVGVIETIVTIVSAQPQDHFVLLPRLTHCYAVLAWAIATFAIVHWRSKLTEYQIY